MISSDQPSSPSSELLDLLSIGWLQFTCDGRVITTNPSTVKLLACPDPSTFFNANFWGHFINPLIGNQIQKNLETQNNIFNLETELRCYTGENIWVRLSIQKKNEAKNNACILECVMEDITAYKRLEEDIIHIQASAYRQRILADVLGRMILSTSVFQDLPSLLQLICSEAVASLDMNSAQIWLLKEHALIGMTAYGPGEEIINGMEIPLFDTEHIGVQVLDKKIPTYLSGLNENGGIVHEAFTDAFPVCSIMAVPLLIAGRAIGVLLLIDEHKIREFTGDDLEFSLLFGNQAAIVVENARMFENLKTANKSIASAYDATLAGWAKALELRDLETEGHTQRVTKLTIELAKKFNLDHEALTQVYRGALLHDIGKMGIPDDILLKPGPLDEVEQEIMRRHPVYAYEMLKPIEYLRPALDIPYCHHEKWDGSGYPRGLKGEQIPLVARIFAVVDVWDALNSSRPYRKAWSREGIIEMIRADAGKHFDPVVVEKFLEIVPTWE